MHEPGRGATRRRFLALSSLAASLGAGCTAAKSEQAVQQATATPVENEETRRDAVRCYSEGVGLFEDGRALLFEGNGAFQEGDYHAAGDAFERAEAAFEDGREEFEAAYDLISWLDLEDERDGRVARTIVEDAGRRTILHLEATGNLREAAVRRADRDAADGDDLVETAREQLETANDHPIRDASRLADVLSVADE